MGQSFPAQTPLAKRLVAEIRETGPMGMDLFMLRCLLDPDHGYYTTRPNLGARGDFITAPMVSQMFGELLGIWVQLCWQALGQPAKVRLVEIGPGDGTLMEDLLRALARAPELLAALELHLVDPSKPLRDLQSTRLGPQANALGLKISWSTGLDQIPEDQPLIILANEILDCLPAQQFVVTETGLAERCVGLDETGALCFGLRPLSDEVSKSTPAPDRVADPDTLGRLLEISAAQISFTQTLASKLLKTNGMALLIDYGRDEPGFGDTLQALKAHQKVPPLEHPGEADLTVWADFPAVQKAALDLGLGVSAITPQAQLLKSLGIEARATNLARHHPDQIPSLERQFARLCAPDQMGILFKALGLAYPAALSLPALAPHDPRAARKAKDKND